MLKEKKTILIYTSICLLIWCFFSLFFAFERLYGDSAYYLFYMINDAKYFIAHHRPASLFIEWIPLIQIKIGSSINSIIYGFSFNEAIFQILAVLLTCLWLKDPFLGFAMIITLFVGAKWNCFNPVSELILGTPVFFFMFGILLNIEMSESH